MALQQAAPGSGGQKRSVHWKSVNVAKGEKWHAWLGGAPHWYTCHTVRPTKPCLDKITGGELVCPYCKSQIETRVMGYIPLYRDLDGMPVHVLVYDTARGDLDAIRFHRRVLVGRGTGKNDTIFVLPALVATPAYQSTIPERHKPAEMGLSLVKLWGIPELSEWFALTEKVTVPVPRQQAGVAVNGRGEPFSPIMQAAAKRFGAEVVDDATTNEEFAAAVRRAKERSDSDHSKNGKPKPR